MASRRNTDAVFEQNGRYVQGGETETTGDRLSWWERREFPRREDDANFTISVRFNKRPDLLSHRLYGTPLLAWLILQYNNIVDINEEFITGKEIVVPSQSRVQIDILNRRVGGKPASS